MNFKVIRSVLLDFQVIVESVKTVQCDNQTAAGESVTQPASPVQPAGVRLPAGWRGVTEEETGGLTPDVTSVSFNQRYIS